MKRLTLSHCCRLPALAFAFAGGPLLAGSYNQNYDSFADGITNLGDGSAISSNPLNAAACSIQGQKMRMSSGAVGGTNSIYRLPDLDPGYEVNGFDLQFDFYLTGGTGLADGMSLNFGGVPLTDTAGPGEEGYSLPGGLVLSFDTYINGGQETVRSIDVRVDGVQVATLDESAWGGFNAAGAQRHVTVRWDSSGLDVIWRNVTTGTDYAICNNLAVPGLLPQTGDRFVFSARTGGETETLDLDNLAITTAIATPITTPDVAFSELVIDNTDHEDEHCNTPGWLELYNGTNTTKDLSTYTLTDDSATPGKWAFPAGTTLGPYQHRLVYFGYDGLHPNPDTRLHTSFAPVKTGGYLGLFNGGALVDSWNPYPAQSEDIAYGYLDQARTLGFLEMPSPGIRNSGLQEAGPPVVEEVTWPRDGGLITGPISLTLGAPVTVGGQIRYTTDNTAPLPTSTLYDHTTPATIPVNASANLRARIYVPGRLPGPVTSRTFLMLDSSITNYRGTGQPFSSNLPVVVIDAFGRSIDAENSTSPGARPYRYTYNMVLDKDPSNGGRTILRETKQDNPSDLIALNSRSPVNFQGRSGMRVRGESSAGMPQRQYAWETLDNEGNDKDSAILGLPADSDWILYAPATDKSLLRNYVVYNSMYLLNGQGSAMRAKLVEVFFNQPPLGGVSTDSNPNITWADYRGVYVLLERIKRGNDRVDIAKLDPCDTSTTLITGGYIFKKDKVSTDPDFTTTNGQGLQVVEPAVQVGDAQYNYLRNYMNDFEGALYGSTFTNETTGWRAWIDETSFQDNELFVEIFKQIDGYRLSTYFTKDRGAKVKSAPLWDYNLSMGNADYLAGWNYQGWYRDAGISSGQSGDTNFQYYWKLRQDPLYMQRLWDRYWTMRRGVLTTPELMARIDAAVSDVTDNMPVTDITNGTGAWPASTPAAESPAARHHARWQRLGQYDWPNAPGFAGRSKYKSSTDAADYTSLTSSAGYNVTTPPGMSESVHIKAYMTNRLNWIDDSNFATGSNTILRPVQFSQYGGNVSAPYSLIIAPYSGTAPAASAYGKSGTLSYATGTIYYTLDGSDPLAPGVTQNLVLDNNDCLASVPTSAAADTDAFGKNWRAWDFTTTAYNAATNPAGYISGINGVGFDNNTTTTPDFGPHINIRWSTTSVPVAGRPTMVGINASSYIRLPFTLSAGDAGAITKLRLFGKVDDGFVAYINGVRLVADKAPASPLWNSGATTTASDMDAIVYREFVPTGADMNAAIAALRTGQNVLAVQGLNSGASSSDFVQRFKLDAEKASPGVLTYTAGVSISANVTVKARLKDAVTSAWTPLTEATFVVDTVPASAANLVVSEIMYNPAAPTAAEVTAGFDDDKMFEYLEVMNIGAGPVDLSGVSFSSAFNFAWPTVSPGMRVLNPGERAVVVGNHAAFNFRYAPAPGIKVAGVMDGNLSNGGERIVLTGASGVIKDFTYDDNAPWPTEPDGSGVSLDLNNPGANPDHNQAINWRASAATHGTPGGESHTPFTGSALADSDGDGIADIVEYATGTAGAAGGGASHHWPASGRTTWTPPGGIPAEYVTFSYSRSRSADGFSMNPQISATLDGWQPLGSQFTLASQTANGDGTETITWRSNQPASALSTRLFLRVEVSTP